MFSGGSAGGQALDIKRKEMIDALMFQRFHGCFKDDLSGFMAQLNKIRDTKPSGELASVDTVANPFTATGRQEI